MKNRIREFRVKNGNITQEDLAIKVKVSRQTIVYIEKGKFNPSVKLALKLAKVLNCKVEDLFELEEGD
ncbi:MAG: helix-turn-helix transcriptional regulator [Candidatus Methanomethylicaceae archaeon]